MTISPGRKTTSEPQSIEAVLKRNEGKKEEPPQLYAIPGFVRVG